MTTLFPLQPGETVLLICREPRVSRHKARSVYREKVRRITADGRALVGEREFNLTKTPVHVLPGLFGWEARRTKGFPFVFSITRDTPQARSRLTGIRI